MKVGVINSGDFKVFTSPLQRAARTMLIVFSSISPR